MAEAEPRRRTKMVHLGPGKLSSFVPSTDGLESSRCCWRQARLGQAPRAARSEKIRPVVGRPRTSLVSKRTAGPSRCQATSFTSNAIQPARDVQPGCLIPGASTASWVLRGFTGSTPCGLPPRPAVGPRRPVSKPGSRSSMLMRRDTTSKYAGLFDSCWDPLPRPGRQRAPRAGAAPGGVQSQVLNAPMTAAMPALYSYVTGVLGYNDDRVLGWDLSGWNPTIPARVYRKVERKTSSSASRSSSQVFRWAPHGRSVQPLPSGVWLEN